MKPTLPYPSPVGVCRDCGKPIKDTDFFGFLWGDLFCALHYRVMRHIKKGSYIRKYGKAVDMGRGSI